MRTEEAARQRREELATDLRTLDERISRLVRGGLVSATGAAGAAIISGKLDEISGLIDIAFVVFLLGLFGLILDYFQYISSVIATKRAMLDADHLFNRRFLANRFRHFAYFAKQLVLAACVLGMSFGVFLAWLSKTQPTGFAHCEAMTRQSHLASKVVVARDTAKVHLAGPRH